MTMKNRFFAHTIDKNKEKQVSNGGILRTGKRIYAKDSFDGELESDDDECSFDKNIESSGDKETTSTSSAPSESTTLRAGKRIRVTDSSVSVITPPVVPSIKDEPSGLPPPIFITLVVDHYYHH